MGAGMARGAAARGKRVAFGDGRRIIWHRNAHAIFRGNPNVAPPGSEGAADLEWIEHYPGARAYCRQRGQRWVFNPNFKVAAGEIFFDEAETAFAAGFGSGFVVIEPNVKKTAANKQWPRDRYRQVAIELRQAGYWVVQFDYGAGVIPEAEPIVTPSIRHALALLGRAALYVGPEGGLHHGAAALSVAAVVIFGGFIHPRTTGYDAHVNLYAGGEPCGTIGAACDHCRNAMAGISVERVLQAVAETLSKRSFRQSTSSNSASCIPGQCGASVAVSSSGMSFT